MNNEMLATGLRIVVMLVFSSLAQHQILSQEQIGLIDPTVVVSILITIGTATYSVWKRRFAGLLSSAANVPDTVVINPGLADGIPKDNVVPTLAEAVRQAEVIRQAQ